MHTSPARRNPKYQVVMAAHSITQSTVIGDWCIAYHTCRRMLGVIGKRAFVGLVAVAFLIPRNMSWSRGRALSETLPCGPLTR